MRGMHAWSSACMHARQAAHLFDKKEAYGGTLWDGSETRRNAICVQSTMYTDPAEELGLHDPEGALPPVRRHTHVAIL